ncbi:MAG: T9SS type A sorting domain-containing protein [Flavobacterium sp.]|uniref:T9SS type A sorting domain-containing protein n=1 Tax=Flavobacterium sp. TaxID=239 RepID=UPI001226C9D3|nr:T9SS type A sorting domain-containing protein [Flavobacterium sp.]RZJ67302.1 MAG: T9SS type A sorting domain-containing protein [Flavobacterium sp.]
MKRKLLIFSAILVSSIAGAQTLLTEDGTSLTVGNVGTDLTGTTPGQGGWLTTVPVPTGAVTDFQVVNVGSTYGNTIQLTGSNAAAANTRRMFKDVSGIWATRDTGNEVAQVQFSYFTGPATTSTNSMRVALYDAGVTKFLAGIMIAMPTRELRGLGYYNNGTTTGNFSFTLGGTETAPAAVILAENTWYTFGFSYNRTTGELKFKSLEALPITLGTRAGAAANDAIGSLNFVATAVSFSTQTTNTVAATNQFDNLNFRALATDGPLLNVRNPITAADFDVYPNPTNDFVNVSTVGAIRSVTIADLNGRTVKQQEFDSVSEAQVSFSDLSSGLYLMTVNGDNASVTKKIMKQ